MRAFLPLLLLLCAAGQSEKDGRTPEPDVAAQKEGVKALREVYRDEYAKKSPDAQKALAAKLADKGIGMSDDPTGRYVFLREAADLAAQAGALDTAMMAVDYLGRSYAVDAGQLRAAVLGKVPAGGRDADLSRLVASAYLQAVLESMRTDTYDAALASLSKGEAAARAAKDNSLLARAAELRKDVPAVQQEFEKVKPLIAQPSGDLTPLGRFWCFSKSEWDKGLPLLATSSEVVLRDLALKDLAAPQEFAAQFEVGEGWFAMADKDPVAPRKKRIFERARSWYLRALASATGISKARVEKRLEDLAKKADPLATVPPTLRIMTLADFEKNLGGQYGATRDLARKGIATSSTFYGDRNPMNVFKGSRTSESWSLNLPAGWFEAKWEVPVTGRVLLLVGRPQPLGHDLWGRASLSVNGGPPMDVPNMEASKVILVESAAPLLFRSIRVEINGSNYPGLSSVEIFP